MSRILHATVLPAPAGLELAAAAAAADPAGLAGAPPWLAAAAEVLGADALLHVALHTGDPTRPLGHLALQRTRAGWRSGSPGTNTLVWPFASIGFGFRPHWCDGAPRDGWLDALRATFPDHRLELARTEPAALPSRLPPGCSSAPGPRTWVRRDPGDVATWQAALVGKHRRDLAKYRRDIAKAGGVWTDTDQPNTPELDQLFALHRSRLQDKGAESAYFDPTVEAFLRGLAGHCGGHGTRLSLLHLDGAPIAGCLSFVHAGRFEAYVSGWDRRQPRLDLGRQVLHHQLLAELPRGLAAIDFLAGDLAYKREFGLQPAPTVDVVGHRSRLAALRAHAVEGAVHAYRRLRRRVPQGVR